MQGNNASRTSLSRPSPFRCHHAAIVFTATHQLGTETKSTQVSALLKAVLSKLVTRIKYRGRTPLPASGHDRERILERSVSCATKHSLISDWNFSLKHLRFAINQDIGWAVSMSVFSRAFYFPWIFINTSLNSLVRFAWFSQAHALLSPTIYTVAGSQRRELP